MGWMLKCKEAAARSSQGVCAVTGLVKTPVVVTAAHSAQLTRFCAAGDW